MQKEYKITIMRYCRNCGYTQEVILAKKGYVEHCYKCGKEFYVPSRDEVNGGKAK